MGAHTKTTRATRQAAIRSLIEANAWSTAAAEALMAEFRCSRRTIFGDYRALKEGKLAPPKLVKLPKPGKRIDLSSVDLEQVHRWLLDRLSADLAAGTFASTARVSAYREIRAIATNLHELRSAQRPEEVAGSRDEVRTRLADALERLPASLRRAVNS